jgi:hypothetical protein
MKKKKKSIDKNEEIDYIKEIEDFFDKNIVSDYCFSDKVENKIPVIVIKDEVLPVPITENSCKRLLSLSEKSPFGKGTVFFYNNFQRKQFLMTI